MLQIHPKQYSAFQSKQEQNFVERMSQFLKDNFEDERKIPEPAHCERILRLTRKAETYGLTTEQQVARFIVIAKVRGENFDHEPDVQAILIDPVLHGDKKIESLIQEEITRPAP